MILLVLLQSIITFLAHIMDRLWIMKYGIIYKKDKCSVSVLQICKFHYSIKYQYTLIGRICDTIPWNISCIFNYMLHNELQ